MRKTKEILRLKLEGRLSNRQVGRAVGVSCSTVSDTVTRFCSSGMPWPPPDTMSDSAFERMLYRPHGEVATDEREPDWEHVRREFGRKHVTLQLLWSEYKHEHPDGYQYSWFCERYRAWAAKLDPVMRQEHKAGERLFVDWAGDTVPIIDPQTGQIRPAYLFVAVLGASSYTYAEATLSQDSDAFLSAHCRTFQFLGGVPEILVPDNLKTGVSRADRYEPEIARGYSDLAAHYGTVVIPARVRKPRDKAKVEAGVLHAYRHVLAPLRNRAFFSLSELNEAIWARVAVLNERPFKKMSGYRKSVFLELDSPALLPLPAEPYVHRTRKSARVHIDYHVELAGHLYSVPHQLVRERVELVFLDAVVEILFDGRRVASHARSHARGRATTDPAHMPSSHREVASWTSERIESWARQTGPVTEALVAAIMSARNHPELGFRSCLGILRLSKSHGEDRLEAACARALSCGARSYKSVKSILDKRLDQVPAPQDTPLPAPMHDNGRGAAYYS
ncbi:MAG: IS21 family transposase [Actinobacteria bacterium HGW-Actinobacteria-10]|nr:MAG: IS21 family transposase [Actinobacteria bacterium HGW-Actinobacteria-10]